jgi:CDP-diacylglycerol--serine O-phosphatidyltransferase
VNKARIKRGVYLVPSILTLSNLSAGMVSIIFSATGHFSSAAWAILAGIVMDMLDGRIARWSGATSQFGLELDSLCDLVTFGVAPGILMFRLILEDLGRPGYMIVIFFAITAALRLARFNLKSQSGEPQTYFVGLPVPAAAGILASFVLSYELFGDDLSGKTIPLLMKRMPLFYHFMPMLMMVLSFLMISTVHYGNFKKMKLGRPKPLQQLAPIAAAVLLILTYPQNTIFIVFSLYVLSGVLGIAWRFYRARQWHAAKLLRRRSTDVRNGAAFVEDEPWNQRR